ncbi:MAG: hypothetical protein FJX95_01325 [Bacteroidetes bacterium]|nr:hypothetical protein [Bacteroidota bacterium]
MRLVVFFCFALMLWGCAQIKMVEGGEKDATSPILLSTDVQDSLLNWKGQGFVLTWDEYVSVQDVVDQITFSPPLQYPLSVVAKGKKVYVSWTDTLRKETTYQVDFGNSIVDITEGNPATLTRIWSTGNVLDSLEISGVVLNGWSGAPVEKAVVQLLSGPFDLEKINKPNYQVKSDKEGKFSFHCLPSASFYLLAFEDKNKSGRWEEGEWLDTDMQMHLTSDEETDIHCVLSQNVGVEPLLGEVTVDSAGWASWKWDPRWGMPQMMPASKDEVWENNWDMNRVKDSILVQWVGKVDNAFHPFKLKFENGKTDSISIPVFVERWKRNPYLEKGRERKVMVNQKVLIPLPTPTSGVQGNKWLIKKENEKGSEKPGEFLSAAVVLEGRQAAVSTSGLLPGKYTLQILPKAAYYQDLEWFVDTVQYTILVLGSEDIGQLQVNTDLPSQGWWSLTDEKGNTQTLSGEQLKNTGMFFIPGTYTLRVVEDVIHDEYWDGMDWKNQREAEVVHVFPKPIVIRANWNQVLEWK